ncbi:hypothetical protein DSO57_1018635 [Entomophthora muscae]|nr:hypothetical protein DSO57_1018635 [Entomophthora muscae]
MKQMDKRFHTQFYAWIRNENNVDYISYYLRRVITEYEQQHFPAIRRAIQWLVAGWSVQRTAELLIKLFYHWGIGDVKFAGLVIQITRQWPVLPGVVDLVVTLVIGERSSKTARFLHHLTATWDTASITELVGAIAVRLRWTERYFKHFLLQFACLGERGWEEKRGLVYSIRHRFNSRRLLMQHAAMLTHDSSIHPSLSLVEFALAILCTIIDQPNPLKSPSTEISISPSAFRLPKTAPASPFLSSSTPSEDLQENPPRSPCSAKLPLTTR